MLGDLLTVAKEIRDLMRQKADQENSEWQCHLSPSLAYILADEEIAQGHHEAKHQSSDLSPEADATTQEPFITNTTNEETADKSEL